MVSEDEDDLLLVSTSVVVRRIVVVLFLMFWWNASIAFGITVCFCIVRLVEVPAPFPPF